MNLGIIATFICVIFALLLGNSGEVLDEPTLLESNGSSSENGFATLKSHTPLPNSENKFQENSEFPPSIFTEDQLKHGAVVLYLLGAMYSFGVIGIVCGDYFLPSVDCICTDLNLSQDIAAATFMSFATTAPELFIILIATFVTNSDFGIGTVVGGGMFNILGVATIGGLAARSPIKLDWWPLYRDSLVYMFAPIALSIVVSDGSVTLTEAVCLIVYYFFYFVIMFFSRRIRTQIKVWIKTLKHKKLKNDDFSVSKQVEKPVPVVPTISLTLDDSKSNEVFSSGEPAKEDLEENDDGSFKAYFINYEDSISLRRISACSNSSCRSTRSRRKSERSINAGKSSIQITISANEAQLGDNLHYVSSKLPGFVDEKKSEDLNGFACDAGFPEEKEFVRVSFLTIPEGTFWNKLTWFVLWPPSFVLYFTIPDCRFKKWRKFYSVTFIMCIFWIGVSSYFGTWMISVVGKTIEIPQSVMGLTFLALGGSMPEAISTFIMSRQGEGGLGFSNSLGGNTMDICLCLGLPWLIKCIMEGEVLIESEGLQYNSVSLVIGIIVLLAIATHTKFHMNKKMGIVCFFFYFLFVVISVLIEMNIIEVQTAR